MNQLHLPSHARVLFGLALILISGAALADAPSLADARRAYFEAQAGVRDLNEAATYMDSVLQKQAGLAIVRVYKGSLRAMQANKADLPWRKMSYMGDALEYLDTGMDQLVRTEANTPGDEQMEALIVSGVTFAAIPRAYGRASMAKRNLTAAVNMAGFSSLPAKTQVLVYTWLSDLYQSDPTEAQRYRELAERNQNRIVADEKSP